MGKPQLPLDHPHAALCWSVSHTGQQLLVIVGQDRKVGIDLESFSRPIEVENLAKRYFTEIEYSDVYRAQAHLKHEVFLKIWTAKEAVSKATGRGLSGSLSTCEVRCQPGETRALVLDRGEDPHREWSIAYCEPWPGFLSAATVEGGSLDVSCWDLTLDVARGWLAATDTLA
ncbi:MAG: 4'-phosphopantetheinyl transferase superfamily protein [Nitrospiraceae bacterium]